jgi:hypothetical protein
MANLYTIESLLIGKTYRSKTLTGEIVSVEKDNRGLNFGENTETYLVQVNSVYRNKWRTIAIKVGA